MAGSRNAQFLQSVREHELLEAPQLAELEQSPLAQGDDLQGLGRLILQKGWLTRFQINLVAQGRARDLILGSYRLIDRLGEGGMGQVFKAHHQPMNRTVALKVIRKEKLANPQAVQRFFREIQAAARLVHPNIVLAFDAGQVEKTYFFAMEYVDGIDLAKLVKQNGPLPEKVACDYIRQAALGLAHAHEQGMIHRDIKPHNLLATRVSDTASSRSSAGTASKAGVREVVKILDMGLARLQSAGPSDHSITQEGAVVGTPDYIAPEQALDARRVDGRSDLYSLGGVFFFLLTGRPPFQGGTLAELLLKHQMETPPDVRQLRPEVSEDVALIVARLLAKRPEERFQEPLELAEALAPNAQGGSAMNLSRQAEPNVFSDLGGGSMDSPSSATVLQPRQAARPKPAEPVSRKKILIGAGVGAAVLLLGLIVFLVIPSGSGDVRRMANAPTEKTPPPTAAVESTAVAEFTLTPLVPLTIKAGESRLLPIQVDRKGLGGKPIQVRLEGLPPGVSSDAAILDGVRDTAQIKLEARADAGDWQRDVQVVATSGTVAKTVAFRLTVQRGAVAVAPTKGQANVVINCDGVTPQAVWYLAPDGKEIVFSASDKALRIVDLQKITVVRTIELAPVEPSFRAMTADGKQLLVRAGDRGVELWDWRVPRQTVKVGLPIPIVAAAMTADGQSILVAGHGPAEEGGNKSVIEIASIPLRKTTSALVSKTAVIRQAALSADGRRMALYNSPPDNVELLDVSAGQRFLGRQRTAGWSINQMEFSPDGKLLFAAGSDGLIHVWDGETLQSVRDIKGHGGPVTCLAVSPDGKYLLSGGGAVPADCTLRLWEIETGQEIKRLEGHTREVVSVAFAPDGRSAASVSNDRTVRQWSLAAPPVAVAPPPPPRAGQARATLQGHEGAVNAVAISSDGKTLASGSNDQTVKLWDVATGQLKTTLQGHTDQVRSVAFSPDGSILASGSNDKTIKLWETASGQVKATLQGFTSEVRCVAFSPDGRTLISTGSGRSLKVWDVATGKEKMPVQWKDAGAFNCVAFSPDGRTIAGGTSTAKITLGDLTTGQEKFTLQGHTSSIYAVAFSSDGRTLASGSSDGTIKLWDVATGQEKAALSAKNNVYSVAFSPDGRTLAAGASDQTIKLWDLEARQEQATLRGHKHLVASVAISPDGRTLASASHDRTVKLWDLKAPADVGVKPPAPVPAPAAGAELWKFENGGEGGSISCLAISPDSRVALWGKGAGMAFLVDLTTGKQIRPLARVSASAFLHAVFLPDGKQLLTIMGDWKVRLWDVQTGRVVREVVQLDPETHGLALAPDGRRFYAGGGKDKTVLACDLETGRELWRTEGHTVPIRRLALSADGRVLLSESSKEVLWWDTATGKQQGGPRVSPFVSAATLSPDGKRGLLSVGTQTVQVIDLQTGEDLFQLGGIQSAALCFAWLPDGRRVLLGGGRVTGGGGQPAVYSDCGVRLYDSTTGQLLQTLPGHERHVRLLAVAPDGRYALSSSADNTLRCWDLNTLADARAATGKAEPPDAARQAEVLSQIKEQFKADYARTSPADRRALAAKLLDRATQAKDDTAVRYSMLREATDLAAGTGSIIEVLKAIDLLTEQFQVDAADLKLQALTTTNKATVNAAVKKAVAEAALAAVDGAVKAGKTDEALELLKLAEAAAGYGKQADLLARIAERRKELLKR